MILPVWRFGRLHRDPPHDRAPQRLRHLDQRRRRATSSCAEPSTGPSALVLTAGQISGSWLSAVVARRLPAGVVRAVVIAVGVTMAAFFAVR
jgi:hypothetical protein